MSRRIPLSIETRRVLKLLIATLFAMLLISSGVFFFKTSSTAEKGYLFRENQLRQKKLESENRMLKQQVLEAQSITGLKASAEISELSEPAAPPVIVEPVRPVSRRENRNPKQ